MKERVNLKVKMTLLSDAIFGSGYSIPGEEDIAVCKDANGYPYMKGSTFKGLLKESMENMAFWMGKPEKEISAILGEEGWNAKIDERRIHLTSFRMENNRQAEECFGLRTFTSLEDGMAKKGTLRTAACIYKGLEFCGTIECSKEDVEFIQDSLRGIKWVGTLRNRGFGNVKITSTQEQIEEKVEEISTTSCIHYKIKAKEPIIITDLNQSNGYHYQTRGYIPGSAIRGMVIGDIVRRIPEWFEEYKVELLSDSTRFLDAVPNMGYDAVIPSIKGFYEKKDGSAFQTVLKNGDLDPGVKRASLGSFCTIKENKILYWSAQTQGVTRIKRDKEKLMFQQRYLCENQEFEGYVFIENPKLTVEIAKAFQNKIWLGADRYEGFGECEITLLESTNEIAYQKKYGYQKQEDIKETIYLLAVSPFTMKDEKGEVCGIDKKQLASYIGVDSLEVEYCSTSISEYQTYNRTWECHSPSVKMYDSGSIFKILCNKPPKLENILALQEKGLGIRLEEGKGQILFMNSKIYENILGKESIEGEIRKEEKSLVELRHKKMDWIMKKNEQKGWRGKISNSQLGTLQALCEQSIAMRNRVQIDEFLEKNRNRGARHADIFLEINQFINQEVLNKPVSETLGIECKDDIVERLKLLCMLFDYSRKGEEQ